MKYVSVIGHQYDEYLCEQLRRKEIYVDFYNASNPKDFNSDCHLLLLDLRGEENTCWAKKMIKQCHKATLVIMLIDRLQLRSAYSQKLIGQFAWDYHTAPFDLDRLLRLIGHALGLIRIRLNCEQEKRQNHCDEVKAVMNSKAMQALSKQVIRAAPTNIPILIRGESGTGKELIAKKIHQGSSRSSGAFIAVNCGSLSSGVVQSELFGHEKGSFTGAVSSHKGKISQADGGTLFLDEIGDLPIEQQVNLLRFLQEGTFDTVGGSKPQVADVRILAATHIDLDTAIERGEFRLDLFYRLNGITLELPPLRERKEDIIPLAEHFCEQYADEFNTGLCSFSEHAKAAMLEHEWIGNVRELINRIRRAVILCENGIIQVADLELNARREDSKLAQGLKTIKNEVEKHAVMTAIQRYNGQMESVARDLKISRATLYRLIDKHEICSLES
ncbi:MULTISPECIES: sigma-54 dependent transcriptional regulator [unclassified Shewanella]|uniref:sigma-54-dependent transcriptional regulator n=1 Tax=unclassified Shewanella TaxID=196818 RepID=UPI001BB8D1F7|nr:MULTISPECIES: sigma-54 dependent transcriptional regulator [unclassified Shewanella]GIU06664.1 sigma-54-dependent Fis family transcriptional regulator [Shewanella sp. MBTL60-112-B1]GIU26529.1 sigma-54-dependent Fis family transcriptional regulator [Shewanella sp. MBTL60-112-B2]